MEKGYYHNRSEVEKEKRETLIPKGVDISDQNKLSAKNPSIGSHPEEMPFLSTSSIDNIDNPFNLSLNSLKGNKSTTDPFSTDSVHRVEKVPFSIYYSPKIVKFVGRLQGQFNLIENGDKILVGVSGGKDSYVLLHILNRLRSVAPINFQIVAVTIDGGTGIDYSPVAEHCYRFNIPYFLYSTPILEIIRQKGREKSSVCSFCARLRRGALYSKAQELGCNKVALGHHLDDAVETFFMGLFYNGIMRTLPPKYRAYNGLEVIRPLIKVRERWIEYMAQQNNFPIISAEKSCLALRELSQSDTSNPKTPYVREKIKKWLRELERENPKLFRRLEKGFGNIDCHTFFIPSN